MAIHDEDLLLISDSQDGNESKKIKYSTLKSNINGDSGNDLQAVTDNGNTTTNGAEFGGTVESSGPNRSFLAQRPDYTDGTTANGYSFAVIDCMDAGNKTTLRLAADGSIFGGSIGNNSVDHQLSNYALNSDGSAEFAGDVTIGAYPNDGSAKVFTGAGQYCARKDDGTGGLILYKDGTNNADKTVQILTNGSADFTGLVDVGAGWDAGASNEAGNRVADGSIYSQVPAETGDNTAIYKAVRGTDQTILFTANGTAMFEGPVTTPRVGYGNGFIYFPGSKGIPAGLSDTCTYIYNGSSAEADGTYFANTPFTNASDLTALMANDGSFRLGGTLPDDPNVRLYSTGYVDLKRQNSGGLYGDGTRLTFNTQGTTSGSMGAAGEAFMRCRSYAADGSLTDVAGIAGDGSATFAGTVVSSSSGATSANMALGGALVGDYGALQAIRPPGTADPSTADVFTGGVGGVQTTKIYADGSATFAGEVISKIAFTYINPDAGGASDVIALYDSGDGTKTSKSYSITSSGTVNIQNGKIILNSDGSGLFADDVISGGNANNGVAGVRLYKTGVIGSCNSETALALRVIEAGDTATTFGVRGGGTVQIGGDVNSNTPNITLNADGSATFAAALAVTPTGTVSKDESGVYFYPGQGALMTCDTASQAFDIYLKGADDPGIRLQSSGSATFAGTVTADSFEDTDGNPIGGGSVPETFGSVGAVAHTATSANINTGGTGSPIHSQGQEVTGASIGQAAGTWRCSSSTAVGVGTGMWYKHSTLTRIA